MIDRRPFDSLGGADHGWLKAKHHFSFASYYDPSNMNWGALRVWNDDEIAAEHRLPAAPAQRHGDHHLCPRRRDHPPGQPGQQRPHRGRRRPGDERGLGHPARRVQSRAETTRIFQIWIEPKSFGAARRRGAPSRFPKGDRSGKFVTLASGFG
jgi:hypothetical protein